MYSSSFREVSVRVPTTNFTEKIFCFRDIMICTYTGVNAINLVKKFCGSCCSGSNAKNVVRTIF